MAGVESAKNGKNQKRITYPRSLIFRQFGLVGVQTDRTAQKILHQLRGRLAAPGASTRLR
jgi:hypothetical protein